MNYVGVFYVVFFFGLLYILLRYVFYINIFLNIYDGFNVVKIFVIVNNGDIFYSILFNF